MENVKDLLAETISLLDRVIDIIPIESHDNLNERYNIKAEIEKLKNKLEK